MLQGRFSGKLPGGPGPGPSSSDTILKDLDLDIRLKLPEEWHQRCVLREPPLRFFTFLSSQPIQCPLEARLNGWLLGHVPVPKYARGLYPYHNHTAPRAYDSKCLSSGCMQSPEFVALCSGLFRLTEQLAADCALLEALRVMDYSLLLGVHYRRGLQPTPLTTDRVRPF